MYGITGDSVQPPNADRGGRTGFSGGPNFPPGTRDGTFFETNFGFPDSFDGADGLADMFNDMLGQMFSDGRGRSGSRRNRRFPNQFNFGSSSRTGRNQRQSSTINIDCSLNDLYTGKVRNLKVREAMDLGYQQVKGFIVDCSSSLHFFILPECDTGGGREDLPCGDSAGIQARHQDKISRHERLPQGSGVRLAGKATQVFPAAGGRLEVDLPADRAAVGAGSLRPHPPIGR